MSRFNTIGTIVSVFSVIYLVGANTNVKITAPQTNPEHPNKCWDTAAQIAYSIGSHNAKNSCQRVHCYPDFRMKYTSCSVHTDGQDYTIERAEDLLLNYPDCCAKVRAERKFKRIDAIDASSVKINKFKGKLFNKKYESTTLKVEEPTTPSPPPVSSSTENIEEELEEEYVEDEYVAKDIEEPIQEPIEEPVDLPKDLLG